MNYENLKLFLRVSRLSIELMGEVNSEEKLKEITGDYSTGLTEKQQKILNHIIFIESELKGNPIESNIKKYVLKLERLTDRKILENLNQIPTHAK